LIVVGVEFDARDCEDVSEEEFGGEAGCVDGLSGEEGGGPFEGSADRPWAVGLGHFGIVGEGVERTKWRIARCANRVAMFAAPTLTPTISRSTGRRG
jgi:hypothetical protein